MGQALWELTYPEPKDPGQWLLTWLCVTWGHLDQNSTSACLQVEPCVSEGTAREAWRDKDPVEATPGAPRLGILSFCPGSPRGLGDITWPLPTLRWVLFAFIRVFNF